MKIMSKLKSMLGAYSLKRAEKDIKKHRPAIEKFVKKCIKGIRKGETKYKILAAVLAVLLLISGAAWIAVLFGIV